MPMLYFDGDRLFKPPGRSVDTSVFDSLKINNLAPYHRPDFIANFWHIKKHSCLAWNNGSQECTVFVPGFLDWRNTLALAREHFEDLMPSAVFFRLNNYEGPYLWD